MEQEGGVVDLLLDWKERNMTEGQGVMVTCAGEAGHQLLQPEAVYMRSPFTPVRAQAACGRGPLSRQQRQSMAYKCPGGSQLLQGTVGRTAAAPSVDSF